MRPPEAPVTKMRSREPQVLPAVPSPGGGSQTAGEGRAAVLVVHGMGQQVPFETLDLVVQGLQKSDGKDWTVAEEIGIREARVGDTVVKRVELELVSATRPGQRRSVDVYESYWAPLTEGRVNLVDVVSFLRRGGVNGVRTSARSRFRRWIFGREVQFPQLPGATAILLLGLAVFAGLVAMNVLAAAIVAHRDWPGAILTKDLTFAMLAFLGFLLPLPLLIVLTSRARRKAKAAGGDPARLALLRRAGMAAFGVALGATVAFLLGAGALVALRAVFGASVPRLALAGALAAALLLPGLAYATWALSRPGEGRASGVAALLLGWAAGAAALWLARDSPWLAAGAGVVALAAMGYAVARATRVRRAVAEAASMEARQRQGVREAAPEWDRLRPARQEAGPRAPAPEVPEEPEPERKPGRAGIGALTAGACAGFALSLLAALVAPAVWGGTLDAAPDQYALRLALGAGLAGGLVALLAGLASAKARPPSHVALVLFAIVGAAAALAVLAYLLVRVGGVDKGLIAGVWLAVAAFSLVVRNLLIQYLGDVAAYVDAQALDKFYELRVGIKEAAKKTADAIYAARTPDGKRLYYDHVVLVGHSLGSVVAYDTLNALLTDDHLALPDPPPSAKPADHFRRVAERTPLFLTFGSPLDRTAFVFATQRGNTSDPREALAMLAQPMIESPQYRERIRWRNVWSPEDIVSSEVRFYEDPSDPGMRGHRVDNKEDPWAVTPLSAHTEYWTNDLVWTMLKKALGEAKT